MAATLDTLQIVKRLREAGFGEAQAEAVTGVFRDLRDADFSQLATKADIQRLEFRIDKLEARFDQLEGRFDQLEGRLGQLEGRLDQLEGRLDQLEGRLDQLEHRVAAFEVRLTGEIARLESKIEATGEKIKNDLLRWVIGLMFAQTALIIALLRLLGAHP